MDPWKRTALEKQLNLKKSLGLTASGTFGKKKKGYPQILCDQDAMAGANFYCYKKPREWAALQTWANEDKGKKVNFQGIGLKNLLRSEHIPFNLFYPLEKLRQENNPLLIRFLERLLGNRFQIDKVNRIKIEFASDLPTKELLNDHTCFDVYIEVMSGDKKIGLGIEVKYTEKSYPYGDTEKKEMDRDSSVYNQLTISSGYFKGNAKLSLNTVKLKQPWRNHLLGLKLLELKELDQFYSLHLFPEGNTYQQKVCDEYINCLKEDYKHSFVPVTFEYFIAVAEQYFKEDENEKWLTYLKSRY